MAVLLMAASLTQPTFHCHASFLPLERTGWLLVRWVLQQIEI